MNYKIGSFALIAALLACENTANDTDIIRYAEKNNIALICRTNEPFLAIEFNADRNGSGRVYYTFPDNTPPDFTGEENLTRTAGDTPDDVDTFFRLSNNLEGTISRTPGGQCEDDMAGTPHNYRITITNWGNGNTDNLPKTGCCDLYQ